MGWVVSTGNKVHTKASGKTTNFKEKAPSTSLMDNPIPDTGRTIRLPGKEFIGIATARYIEVSGSLTGKMAMEFRSGIRDNTIRVAGQTAVKTATES